MYTKQLTEIYIFFKIYTHITPVLGIDVRKSTCMYTFIYMHQIKRSLRQLYLSCIAYVYINVYIHAYVH